jgi:hypothetical protein
MTRSTHSAKGFQDFSARKMPHNREMYRIIQKKTQPKPQAPKFAQLEFSFYVSEAEKFPKLFQSISVPSDRSFDLEFFAKNISNDVAAERGDIFMAVCLECRYMKEPTGFQKLSESPESTRHKTFDIINPGLSLEPWTVSILPPSLPFAFDVSFQYECKTCGPKHAVQVLKVDVLRGEN